MVSTVRFPRQTTALLCVASLLLGNVAGWMHVGCAGVADHTKAAVACASSDRAALHTGVGTHQCCYHSTERLNASEQARASDPIQDAPSPIEHHCPIEHDTDRCSICQNFFTSRDTATIAEPTLVEFQQLVEFSLPTPGQLLAVSRRCRNIFTRGPPSV